MREPKRVMPACAAGTALGESSGTYLGDDLYRLLIDRVQDYAIFALDPAGYILSWNSGAEHLKGYAPSEAIGQHFSIFYPPEDLAAGKPEWELKTAIANGRVEDEGWRVRKDGSRFWADVLITALKDDDGTLLGFSKVTRDLTERRRAEESLRQSEARFRLLVQSVKDYAIFMLDPTGHVATWNEGAQHLKGYNAEEIIGQHFSVFYIAEDVNSVKLKRKLSTAVSAGVCKDEGWRVRKDGSHFWANVIITPVRSADGELLGFVKVTRDLTERRAAQERTIAAARRIAAEEAARTAAEQRAQELKELANQLQVQTAELERQSARAETANRAKGEFLAAMSHELRTPLNAIGGYAQLMHLGVSGPLTPRQREQLERILHSQQHLLGIINDILNFSRIEAGQVAYNIGTVSVSKVIGAVTPMIVPQVQAKQLQMTTTKCSPSFMMQADRSKVEQILLNLLSNAVKFTPAGGKIDMACGKEQDHVWISVHDTGIGIPAEQVETIFEPFVQIGRGLANPQEGTGLGLAISRDLARAMHGNLTVESRESVGSKFVLTLPIAH